MKKTRIDWCDATWNPVTGCLHGCEYCYARKIAERFAGWTTGGVKTTDNYFKDPPVLDKPLLLQQANGNVVRAPYPFGFKPTFHRYLLGQPAQWTKPRTIFVCSMADLFGNWVPDEWITEVFEACKAAPQHTYLFLTKNPVRYDDLCRKGLLPHDKNMWFGTSVCCADDEFFYSDAHNTFLSIEPILEEFPVRNDFTGATDWIIVGAETGNRADKVVPERVWIDNLVQTCDNGGIPIFMKSSLTDLMGEDMRQEYPFSSKNHNLAQTIN